MNKWMSRFPATLLAVLILVLGTAPAVSAQEPGADLSLTKTADRTNVKIAQSDTFDLNLDNNTASLHLHIVGNTH